jgi:hypothetical protein
LKHIFGIVQKTNFVERAFSDSGKDDCHRIDPVFRISFQKVHHPDSVGRKLAAEKNVDEVNVSDHHNLGKIV